MKSTTIILGVIVIVFALIGLYGIVKSPSINSLGGYLTSTITSASSTVGTNDVLVISPSSGVQYYKTVNLGPGRAFCYINTTSTLANGGTNAGIVINPVGSSTLSFYETSDPNIIGKALHCRVQEVGATTTLSIIEY